MKTGASTPTQKELAERVSRYERERVRVETRLRREGRRHRTPRRAGADALEEGFAFGTGE